MKNASKPAAFTTAGLNIHIEKDKILKCNTVSTSPITYDGEALEEMEAFTSLRSITDKQRGPDAYMKVWVGKPRRSILIAEEYLEPKTTVT